MNASSTVLVGTPHLRIVPFGDRHLTAEYVDWLNDRELMRFSEQRHRPHTLEACQAYVRSFKESLNYFVAIERKVGEPAFIGTATLYLDRLNSVANIGILIGNRSVQGQGVGSEAWIGMMVFAFEFLGVRKVEAGALSINRPMIRVFRKTGMKDDGRRLRHVLREGIEVDLIHAAGFRGEWTASIPVEIEARAFTT